MLPRDLSLIGLSDFSTAASLMGSGIALLAGMGRCPGLVGGAWHGRVAIRPFRYTWVLAGFCALAPAFTAASLTKFDLPHGDWDAWSIWSLRAIFWRPRRAGVTPLPLLFRSHLHYPRLTSAVGAHFNPGTLAMVFFGAVPAVLISTVAPLRGLTSGRPAGLACAASAGYITQAPRNTRISSERVHALSRSPRCGSRSIR